MELLSTKPATRLQPECLSGEIELVWVASEGVAGAGKDGSLQPILPLSFECQTRETRANLQGPGEGLLS